VQISGAKPGVERRLGRARAGGKVGSRRSATPIRRYVRKLGQNLFGICPILRRGQDDVTVLMRIGLRRAWLGIH
jgi:hypothetical protein